MDDIRISCGDAELTIAPVAGGGIAALTLDGREILRPAGKMPGIGRELAAIILVPFSNRIGEQGFDWNGDRFAMLPNIAGEAIPIHGDGWQRAWTVSDHGVDHVRLVLNDGAIGPYVYSAVQEYRLRADGLVWTVTITNRAGNSLPYGCGFHPWFPRDDHTRLEFTAAGMWMNDERHLSDYHVDIGDPRAWDFRTPAALPDGLINNGYTGCTGTAKLHQGASYPDVQMAFSSSLDTAIVFSPGAEAPFVCFEPVSHPINAHHMPGRPGLVPLNQGAAMSARMEINWTV